MRNRRFEPVPAVDTCSDTHLDTPLPGAVGPVGLASYGANRSRQPITPLRANSVPTMPGVIVTNVSAIPTSSP
jgi:hypothetical protein